jgi:hypothetical protein
MKIRGNQILTGTVPVDAISGTIGGGGGGGSSFGGVTIPVGFQIVSEAVVPTGFMADKYIGNSGYFVGWAISIAGSGTASIGISRSTPSTGFINMIGTGIAPSISAGTFASGSNFLGWSSTGVALGDTLRFSVSNISGSISGLTFNLLNRNI